ncbi:biotin-dependent carboxyltransferase family protein [Tissierella creatinini]|nr:biotin-dependent carboxyltransferase family protein [Tissierella creatinini]TJX63786.1 biotin-dependent carboxyltransferase family protein [Soehngenia saccharolytica]
MNRIRFIKSGLFTTIQDKGRWGYQQFGMPVAGAMDNFASRVANLLVGNDENEALLETTFMGPEIEFDCHEIIAITGANMKPKINGDPVAMWTSIPVSKGDKLSFESAVTGLRGYIAFSRIIKVPEIMGSKSTYIRGKLGGLEGRKITNGDELTLGEKTLSDTGTYIPKNFIPIYPKEYTLRIILGPQDDYFTEEGIQTFLNSTYKITSEADRMGYRLDGPLITHKKGADIISDGIVFGSVQVPGSGLPIIMMSDRGTTGGYTKIATVVTPDLSILAQMAPGTTLTFEKADVYESHKIYKEYEENISQLKDFMKNYRFEFHNNMMFNLNLLGKKYSVTVKELIQE